MLEESKDLIIKNFLTLMKECNVDVLKELMVKKGVFTATEIANTFLSDDARHNKRVFFFNIQKKDQKTFYSLIEALKETNQHKIVKLLVPGVTGCRPMCFPPVRENNSNIDSVPTHVSLEKGPLNINVVKSTEFFDTPGHNEHINFYKTRSKKRGKVLIINNYEYDDPREHNYRNGAKVDNKNLQELFKQMGGWQIYQYDNKTTKEMMHILQQFSEDQENDQYDICFVIIMAHGKEYNNSTIIFGKDGTHMFTRDIHKNFTNDMCKGFRGKPKIFIFQVCRGSTLDYTVLHTEVDGEQRSNPSLEQQNVAMSHIRTQEDMLTGYATLHGYKAHRDPFRGSWYIELICKNFMKFAHKHPVTTLLQLVDQDLSARMSEFRTMQTAEHRNKGFKNLYLNPGIYYEDGELKHFHL